MRGSRKQQGGYLLILCAVMVVIIGFLVVAVTQMFYGSAMSTVGHFQSDSALYIADGGLQHATHKLLNPTVAQRLSCAGAGGISAITLGSGQYTVTSAGPYFPSSITTLSSAVTAAATTIPVGSTSAYQSAGRIMIDKELMDYSSTNSTSFLGVKRGVDGRVASAHASGAAVGQYQCNLTSVGSVPNQASSKGSRSITQMVQLQNGWAVGDLSAGHASIEQWNNSTELKWNDYSSLAAVAQSMNSVYATSYADVWAAGGNSTILHWNGVSLGSTTITPASIILRGIYCTANNSCHVVGDHSGTKQVISDWNGTAWVQSSPTGTAHATNLFSVMCDSASDCWAVGDNNGGVVFYRYVGSQPWVQYTQTVTASPYHGVYCNATNDCWAVGANAKFARLTSGTTWADFATGLPAVQYNSIYCNSASDCWAAGNVSAAKVVLAHYNGTSWSLDTSYPTPAVNLNAVSCYNSNDCWATGANSGGQPVFYHWNGTAWSNVTVSGLPNVTLRGLSLNGPISKPSAVWQEKFKQPS